MKPQICHMIFNQITSIEVETGGLNHSAILVTNKKRHDSGYQYM